MVVVRLELLFILLVLVLVLLPLLPIGLAVVVAALFSLPDAIDSRVAPIGRAGKVVEVFAAVLSFKPVARSFVTFPDVPSCLLAVVELFLFVLEEAVVSRPEVFTLGRTPFSRLAVARESLFNRRLFSVGRGFAVAPGLGGLYPFT